jgi:hypothetical protein
MWFRSLFDSLKTGSARVPARQARRVPACGHPRTRRLQVEPLEDRRVLSFVPAGPFPVGNRPLDVLTADFNNDGRLDLATTDSGSRTVSVLLGERDGTFQPALQSPAFHSGQLAVGDFDGDGNADLLTYSFQRTWDSSVYGVVLLGNGDGTFQAEQEVAIPAPLLEDGNAYVLSYAPAEVRVTDINGDGRSDLGVYAEYTYGYYLDWSIFWGDYYVVLLGAADGSFQEGAGSPADFPPEALPDLNGDGLGDAVADVEDGVSVRLGREDGTFAPALLFPAGLNPSGVAAGDFNGDGQPDVAVANAGSHDVSVLLNDGDWPAADAPTIRVSDVTVTEGHTGTVNATFTVTLSAAYDQVVTVDYSTSDSSATAGSDYQAASGTLTFAPGETIKNINVVVTGDRLGEPNELFFVTLGSPTNAIIADIQGAATIIDDEPRVSINDVTKKEGNGKKTTLFTFTVMLSAAYDQPVTMSYQTVKGTATTGDNDYVAKSGTLTFAPGETTKTITIEVKGDSKKEASETFYLDLFGLSSNASFTKSRGIGTILSDD